MSALSHQISNGCTIDVAYPVDLNCHHLAQVEPVRFLHYSLSAPPPHPYPFSVSRHLPQIQTIISHSPAGRPCISPAHTPGQHPLFSLEEKVVLTGGNLAFGGFRQAVLQKQLSPRNAEAPFSFCSLARQSLRKVTYCCLTGLNS